MTSNTREKDIAIATAFFTSCLEEKELKQTRTCFVDTRYKAKLRLFNYLNGGECKYNPFKGTEIGKTLPILNF